MKKSLYILAISCLTLLSSCSDWLDQEDMNSMGVKEAYSTTVGINSITANLYSRMRYEQDFARASDGDAANNSVYDIASWDEAIDNSQYWAFATNKNQGYRSYYDYTLIREINIHIYNLQNNVGGQVSSEDQKYFLAEARYLRAYVYFTLVSRMGGVPIIDYVTEYTEDPLKLAKPRNKESEVYDFILSELDAVKDDLSFADNNIKTRATKGTALALKNRAMLYAGTIAYNHDLSATKGLNLASGATGIDKSQAKKYLEASLSAYEELKAMNVYSLYKKNSNDLSANYASLFVDDTQNSEVIFSKAFNGKTVLNYFTTKNICRSMKSDTKAGAELNPVLNLVDAYELLTTHNREKINPYDGAEQIEEMRATSSTFNYHVYDKPEDIFAGRDPRLKGTILYPGSTFRGVALDFQAGLAVKTATGYTFKSVALIENTNDDKLGYYEGVKMTGEEGPHKDSYNVSHSGFLLRKYVDDKSGAEIAGGSSVSYIVFRYGEVLLNAAEAAFYLNELGYASYNGKVTKELALECINEVRRRAGGDSFTITMSELNFDRIVNERRVELAFEDHRYNDLKRMRIADQVWLYDRNNESSVMTGLWPYKIYAPGQAIDGKWIYRKVKVDHRGAESDKGRPINFDLKMYYATYPMNEGNPYIEPNPNH